MWFVIIVTLCWWSDALSWWRCRCVCTTQKHKFSSKTTCGQAHHPIYVACCNRKFIKNYSDSVSQAVCQLHTKLIRNFCCQLWRYARSQTTPIELAPKNHFVSYVVPDSVASVEMCDSPYPRLSSPFIEIQENCKCTHTGFGLAKVRNTILFDTLLLPIGLVSTYAFVFVVLCADFALLIP